MTEISCEKIKQFHDEEVKGSKDYKDVGEEKLSRDEKGHADYWKDKWKKNKCEGKL